MDLGGVGGSLSAGGSRGGGGAGGSSGGGGAAAPTADRAGGGGGAAAAADGDDGGADGDDDGAGGEKKQRFVWSPEVHQSFCDAVHSLGVDKAKPQAIAAIMQNDATVRGPGMPTRQNIKSHLQKYRLFLAKRKEQEERRAHNELMHGHHRGAAAHHAQGRGFGRGGGGGGGYLDAHSHLYGGLMAHHGRGGGPTHQVDFSGAMGDDDADGGGRVGAGHNPFGAVFGGHISPHTTFDLTDLVGTPMQGGGLGSAAALHGALGGLPMGALSALQQQQQQQRSGLAAAAAAAAAAGNVGGMHRGAPSFASSFQMSGGHVSPPGRNGVRGGGGVGGGLEEGTFGQGILSMDGSVSLPHSAGSGSGSDDGSGDSAMKSLGLGPGSLAGVEKFLNGGSSPEESTGHPSEGRGGGGSEGDESGSADGQPATDWFS